MCMTMYILSPLPLLPPQNYLRYQTRSKVPYNLIAETLRFLDCICGVTTGGLMLLSLYIHANNAKLINQCMVTLTEYCQGPCHENQVRYMYINVCIRVHVYMYVCICVLDVYMYTQRPYALVYMYMYMYM